MYRQGTEFYEGLAALHGAGLSRQDPDETSALQRARLAVARFGQPALEVGCGVGRTLVPLRADGFDVDGCDLSLQMLLRCRQAALKAQLELDLYWQAMQELELPRRYRTILVPAGAFMHVIDRGEAVEALHRFHRHLLPGGTLVLTLYTAAELPQPTDDERRWRALATLPLPQAEADLVVEQRTSARDPLEQVLTDQRRYRLRLDGRVLYEETRTGQYRWYGKHDLQLMMAWVGFGELQVTGLTSGGAPTATPHEQALMVVTGRRQRSYGLGVPIEQNSN